MTSKSCFSLIGCRPPNTSPYIFYIKFTFFKAQMSGFPEASAMPYLLQLKDLSFAFEKIKRNQGVTCYLRKIIFFKHTYPKNWYFSPRLRLNLGTFMLTRQLPIKTPKIHHFSSKHVTGRLRFSFKLILLPPYRPTLRQKRKGFGLFLAGLLSTTPRRNI